MIKNSISRAKQTTNDDGYTHTQQKEMWQHYGKYKFKNNNDFTRNCRKSKQQRLLEVRHYKSYNKDGYFNHR